MIFMICTCKLRLVPYIFLKEDLDLVPPQLEELQTVAKPIFCGKCGPLCTYIHRYFIGNYWLVQTCLISISYGMSSFHNIFQDWLWHHQPDTRRMAGGKRH